jgi:exopolysaccharide biosynthesis WecB/TagA/CpsF family protein
VLSDGPELTSIHAQGGDEPFDATASLAAPRKLDLFGVGISASNYAEVVSTAVFWARQRRPAILDFMPVHGLVTASRPGKFRDVMHEFDVVAPDGQPVRWALNLLHHTKLRDRVYGPECMWRLCAAAEEAGLSIYLFGGSPVVLDALVEKIQRTFPRLVIAGSESPPFRPLTSAEDAAVVQRINDSGAHFLFLGIGCPKQEMFAHAHRDSIQAVQFCVGAAFDFHAGAKKTAPAWMQRNGLEWLFRLASEPRRLAKRYAVTNTVYLLLMARALTLQWLGASRSVSPTE